MKTSSIFQSRWAILLLFIFGCAVSSAQQQAQLYSLVEDALSTDMSEAESRKLAQARGDRNNELVIAVRLNRSAVLSNVILVPMPNGETLEFTNRRISKGLAGQTWIGRDPRTGQTAILTSSDTDFHGILTTRAGIFEIMGLGDGVYALVKQRRREGPEEPPDLPRSARE